MLQKHRACYRFILGETLVVELEQRSFIGLPWLELPACTLRALPVRTVGWSADAAQLFVGVGTTPTLER